MAALVRVQGCARCGVAHCPHAPAHREQARNHNDATTVVMVVVGFLLVFGGGGVAVEEATTPASPKQQPAPAPPQGAWSAVATRDIPVPYQVAYTKAAETCPKLTPYLLAGIGRVESNHGKSQAPGVHEGLNFADCCRGPMQFNTENGSPSTWDAFSEPGWSPYNPEHAIIAAARKLCANGLEPSDSNRLYQGVEDPCPDLPGPAAVHRALRRYNNECVPYARDVLEHAASYAPHGKGAV